MKNIICLIIIVFGAVGIYAQEKMLTREQFDAMYRNSFEAWSLENWKGKSFRNTTTTHSSTEGRPQTDYSSKYTIEYASPTTYRSVSETSFGDKKSKTESIRLGEKIYTRKDGEIWKEGIFTAKTEPVKKDAPAASASDEQIEYKFLGSESLNNQTTDIYAKIVKTKRPDPSGTQETLTTSTTKYWFSKDGFLLKLDMVMESRTGEKTVRTLLTQTWEPDESIKIDDSSVKRSE